MVAATYADGKREVLLLGVPGDREIDMRRLEASLGADVEMATPEDMAAYPNIVPGFTGPTCAGPDHPDRKIDEDGNISGSPRCLLDPRAEISARTALLKLRKCEMGIRLPMVLAPCRPPAESKSGISSPSEQNIPRR